MGSAPHTNPGFGGICLVIRPLSCPFREMGSLVRPTPASGRYWTGIQLRERRAFWQGTLPFFLEHEKPEIAETSAQLSIPSSEGQDLSLHIGKRGACAFA